MNHPAHFGEERAPVPYARQSPRPAVFEGEPVIYVPLSDGREAMVSRSSWEDHCALGFSPRLSADSNGAARRYPRHMVNDPRPDAGRSRAVSLGRTLTAQLMVKAELAGGARALAKGWVVRHVNGDTLDCRDSNLLSVPARGCRNGYRAVWNVRERWALVRQGLDPNRLFAQRRREARRKSSAAFLRSDTRSRAPGVPPLGSVKGPGDVVAHNGGAH